MSLNENNYVLTIHFSSFSTSLDLEDTILIGIIAGAVALFLILTIVFIACCCCFCPDMCCGGCFGGPQQQHQDPYFNNAPYMGEIPPPQLPLAPPPMAPMPIGPPPMSYFPEPEPQLPMVMSQPPPPPEPTYNYSYREREPERREVRVLFFLFHDQVFESRYNYIEHAWLMVISPYRGLFY